MAYSNKDIAERIKKAKKNKKNLTHITNKDDLSLEDQLKLSFCKHFVQFAVQSRKKLTEVSKLTGIPLSRLSEITNYKINKFTVDQLIKNLSKLAEHEPKLQEYLLFIREAVELPMLKVAQTRKLTKTLVKTTKSFVHA